jgi:hypothetical protein
MIMSVKLRILLGCLGFAAAVTAVTAVEPKFTPVKVVRPFKAITNAPTVPANQAERFVRDDELVLGVEINGSARAYPINMLTNPTREIINDSLGGQHIAATW